MTPNADGTLTVTWMTGLQELPTYRVVMDLDAGVLRQEMVTPGRVVSDAEYNSGAYRPPVRDDRVAVIERGARRLTDPREAALIFAGR